ncbi:MAG TPA: hypothetical protein PK640_08670 [Verrucomicrobiota bacterium]|nr:hypothetical protein [Verrucomicrobiota bacterium]
MRGPGWDNWLERLCNLRRDKSGQHERPHKPVLLLSVIDLLDRGLLTDNAVPLSDELVATFKRYFEVVRKHNDQPTVQNPFFHLSGDKFWQLVPRPGKEPIYREGYVSGAPGVRQLREAALYGRFDTGLRSGYWSCGLRQRAVKRCCPSKSCSVTRAPVCRASVMERLLNFSASPTSRIGEAPAGKPRKTVVSKSAR